MSKFNWPQPGRLACASLVIIGLLAGGESFAAHAAQEQEKSSQKKSAEKATDNDVARGKTVFQDNCAECHDAYSRDEIVGPGLQGIKDGKLPDGRDATADRLLDIINTGPAEMPSFKDRLSEEEKKQVIAFVLTL